MDQSRTAERRCRHEVEKRPSESGGDDGFRDDVGQRRREC
jgi:hypothetical protein